MKMKTVYCIIIFALLPAFVITCSAPVETGVEQLQQQPEIIADGALRLFPLNSVRLLNGPFKTACDLNTEVLLEYEVDRLLAPYLKEAGLQPKGESFSNWIDLDGHVGGHYLSALAITWAATGDPRIKERMEYMLSELKRCQDRNGHGYVGGVPYGRALWDSLKKAANIAWVGDTSKYWVPWYNIHKIFAGLRDAWLYAGNVQAKEMFLKLCDWGLDIVEALDATVMETMLNTEFGGMNEVYADAYAISGNIEYLYAAKRFSHKVIFDSMAISVDNLDGRHANTQVPKAVGYARVAEITGDARFYTAGSFFWNTVTKNRSLVFGGNSRNEAFTSVSAAQDYINSVEGPESCNTYNMLKLTETLFKMDPKEEYAAFYERAMFNHILSTQNPESGGYVYFTPARPQHYRVYSTVNEDMWCCVGSGMENHGKYGEFIYAHTGGSLYVNQFIASELDWKERGIKLTQNTIFPDEEQSSLVFTLAKPVRLKLLIRNPTWTDAGRGGFKVIADGVDYASGQQTQDYIEIDREWKNGDTVDIKLPMDVHIEQIPNLSAYIAIVRGPIVLSAKTSTEDGLRQDGDGSRWGHVADGIQVAVSQAPIIIGEPEEILAKLKAMQAVADESFTYTVEGLFSNEVVLQPFFRIYDSRYQMYWMALTEAEYELIREDREQEEAARLALENRTVDKVQPGYNQSEASHNLQTSNSATGAHQGENWRDASNGGWFQYDMDTKGETNLSLFVRYWGNEGGARSFTILIDGQTLTAENLTGKWNRNEFVNVEYLIPADRLQGKTAVTVRFQCGGNNFAGGIFYLRLVKNL